MKTKASAMTLTIALSISLSWSFTAAGAQVYKWKDLEGSVNYSDNPYTPKKEPKAEQIEFKLPGVSHEEIMGEEEAPAPAPVETASLSEDAKRQDEITKSGVEDLGFKITPSASGRALITSTVKNNMPYPAAGLRVDVILYTKDRKRLPDIEMRYTGGKPRPDWLAPGETAELTYETDSPFDDIVGHNYQVVWASITQAPNGKEPGLRKVLIDKETGLAKEIKPEAPAPAPAQEGEPEAQPSAM